MRHDWRRASQVLDSLAKGTIIARTQPLEGEGPVSEIIEGEDNHACRGLPTHLDLWETRCPISELLRNITVLKRNERPARLELPISFLYVAVGAGSASGSRA